MTPILLHNAKVLIRNRKVAKLALRKHAAARGPLAKWLDIAKAAEWRNIIDARAVWPTADAIKGTGLTCFNIAGNNFRLITIVSYQRQEIAIVEVLTHAEYDKKY